MEIKSKIKIFQLIFLFFFVSISYSQIKFETINCGLSIGSLNGNFTPVTTFGGKISFDFKLWFSEVVNFRFGYEHARSIDYYLPDKLIKNFPFINYYFLTTQLTQSLYKKIFIEEGIGFIILNDRTFSDRNFWLYGTKFSLFSGFDLRDANQTGIKISAGFSYGITFNKSNVNFSLITTQINYYF